MLCKRVKPATSCMHSTREEKNLETLVIGGNRAIRSLYYSNLFAVFTVTYDTFNTQRTTITMTLVKPQIPQYTFTYNAHLHALQVTRGAPNVYTSDLEFMSTRQDGDIRAA